jgi:hypothetical protein
MPLPGEALGLTGKFMYVVSPMRHQDIPAGCHGFVI